MCGILGIVTKNNDLNIDINRFLDSLNLLEHRGPDDVGHFAAKRFIFGHRRLSIIDLSKNASQPMVSNDENVSINKVILCLICLYPCIYSL